MQQAAQVGHHAAAEVDQERRDVAPCPMRAPHVGQRVQVLVLVGGP